MDLRARLRKLMPPDPIASGVSGPIPEPLGLIIERDEGVFVKRELDYPLSHRHGEQRFEDVLEVDPNRIAMLGADPSLAAFDVRRAAFLDVETTSLSGGAGTYVFLTGVAWLDGDRLRLAQYFMRDFDEELALLADLLQDLRRFEFLVTFFGKNFDRHRLMDRFTFHALESTLPERHLDLCHAGRRMFGGTLPDVRLKTLERCLLGIARHDDLPGAECAQTYFDFLCGRDDGRLRRVFEHNLVDVLSLVTLAARLDRIVASPALPIEHVGRARVLDRAEQFAEAADGYERALTEELPRHVRAPILARLGSLGRRLGRVEQARRAFLELRELMPASHLPPLELARLVEREQPADALGHVDEALAKLLCCRTPVARADREALERRRARLLRRVAKSSPARVDPSLD